MLFVAGFIILMTSFRRTRLGVGGTQGESMLVDLRDRIQRQGGIPDLPDGWHLESALRSAGGTPFAGDFIVTVRTDDRLDVVVVDVSGKGEGAGTRALLLSGAFGGLLGALPADEFLTAANDFLLRQNWDEGFATAVHLSLDVAHRRVRGPHRRAPARRPAGRRLGALDGPLDRRAGARPDRRDRVPLQARDPAPGRRDHALHRRPGRDAQPRHRARASTGCSARPSSCSAASSRAAPSG